MINPKDLIQTLSVEALAETADAYFRKIVDPTFWLSKPFGALAETPTILTNVGMLIGGLKLCKTMTVLEFGAGTCWLSRFLQQAQLQTISCDVSPAALEIGKRLFAEFPIAGTPITEPRFLVFNGRNLDLPDASVDRIICNDAFHHVPNQREVLAEMARVLRPGGIAGFAEPGRFHSQSATSQFEMRTGNVLENDIDVHEIFALAQAVGFTNIRLKLLCDAEINLDQHAQLTSPVSLTPLAGDQKSDAEKIVALSVRNAMQDRSIFFLYKGALIQDSRGADGLAHQLSTIENTFTVNAGEPLAIALDVLNAGTATWLTENVGGIGVVNIGTHLYDAMGAELAFDHSRHALPQGVAPGNRIKSEIWLNFPTSGSYKLCIDLVAEQVSWFEQQGAVPLYVNINVL